VRFNTSVEQEIVVIQRNNCGPLSLTELCQEAIERCGGDWAEVEAYLQERLAQLAADDREILEAEINRTLRFSAPNCPTFVH
jgi:hypothetical protein